MESSQKIWLGIVCLAVMLALVVLANNMGVFAISQQSGLARSQLDQLENPTLTATARNDLLSATQIASEAIRRGRIDGVIIGAEEPVDGTVNFVVRCRKSSKIARYRVNVDNLEVVSTGLDCQTD